MLGDILLKVSTNGKFPCLDDFSLFSNIFFHLHPCFFQSGVLEILIDKSFLMKPSLRSFKCLITSDVLEHFVCKA